MYVIFIIIKCIYMYNTPLMIQFISVCIYIYRVLYIHVLFVIITLYYLFSIFLTAVVSIPIIDVPKLNFGALV